MNTVNIQMRASIVFHGFIVFAMGVLAGFPYGTAVTTQADPRAWHMAHLEGFLNGLFLIAVGACGGLIRLRAWQRKFWYAGLLVTGYGNALGACIAALFHVRGITTEGPFINILALSLFMVAVLGVVVVLLLSCLGALHTARSVSAE